jgi:hypothetical protein
MGSSHLRKHKKAEELNTEIDKFQDAYKFNEIQKLKDQHRELKNIDKNHNNILQLLFGYVYLCIK